MFKVLAGLGIVIAFIGWILFRLIKKDLKEHLNDLLAGLFFIAFWVIIYLIFTH